MPSFVRILSSPDFSFSHRDFKEAIHQRSRNNSQRIKSFKLKDSKHLDVQMTHRFRCLTARLPKNDGQFFLPQDQQGFAIFQTQGLHNSIHNNTIYQVRDSKFPTESQPFLVSQVYVCGAFQLFHLGMGFTRI